MRKYIKHWLTGASDREFRKVSETVVGEAPHSGLDIPMPKIPPVDLEHCVPKVAKCSDCEGYQIPRCTNCGGYLDA